MPAPKVNDSKPTFVRKCVSQGFSDTECTAAWNHYKKSPEPYIDWYAHMVSIGKIEHSRELGEEDTPDTLDLILAELRVVRKALEKPEKHML